MSMELTVCSLKPFPWYASLTTIGQEFNIDKVDGSSSGHMTV